MLDVQSKPLHQQATLSNSPSQPSPIHPDFSLAPRRVCGLAWWCFLLGVPVFLSYHPILPILCFACPPVALSHTLFVCGWEVLYCCTYIQSIQSSYTDSCSYPKLVLVLTPGPRSLLLLLHKPRPSVLPTHAFASFPSCAVLRGLSTFSHFFLSIWHLFSCWLFS